MAKSGAAQNLSTRLEPILRIIERQEVVESISVQQAHGKEDLVENLVHRQQEAELRRHLNKLPAPDIAHLLEMLPVAKRLLVWRDLKENDAGSVLLEASDAVRKSLLENTAEVRLITILSTLDTEDLAEVADLVEPAVLMQVKARLESSERIWLEDSMKYEDNQVGAIMDKDCLIGSMDWNVNEAVEAIRTHPDLPPQTDKLFIVNRTRQLVGVVYLVNLLKHPGNETLAKIMDREVVSFSPEDAAKEAAQAFERYDLISTPVVDSRRKILGRLTVESVMDFVREQSESQLLIREGLNPDSDLFGPVIDNAKQRWPWLAINLCTAVIASRFIGLFEHTIGQLVALATLMPIVASMAGNTGNQTAALVIRGLALNQLRTKNLKLIVTKEIKIGLYNGSIWGTVLGVLTYMLYGNFMLAVVMAVAILLNFAIAAGVGICIPLILKKMDKDPAMGSSVMLTFMTDSMGFLIFLGLATIFLV